jgi:flagella basal body P-ring formation protein FlgA
MSGKQLPEDGTCWSVYCRGVVSRSSAIQQPGLSVIITSPDWHAACFAQCMNTTHKIAACLRHCLLPLLLTLAMLPGCSPARADSMPATDAIENPDDIRAAATLGVMRSPAANGRQLQLQAATLDPRLRLRHCESALLANVAGDGQLREQTVVNVRCERPAIWQVGVRVAVAAERQVLVSRRALSRGSTPAAEDFASVLTTVGGDGAHYISELSALTGTRLRVPMNAGVALTVDALELAPLIRRGQQVTLVARAAGIEIRVAAIALADAGLAQHLSVQNLSSHQLVDAVVRSAALVEVGL